MNLSVEHRLKNQNKKFIFSHSEVLTQNEEASHAAIEVVFS